MLAYQKLSPLTLSNQSQLEERTFRQAQPEGSIPPVLSAWAVIPTESLSAQHCRYGIIPSLPLQSDPTKFSPCEMEGQSVEIGSVPQVAPAPIMTPIISALAVLPPLTELRTVLEHRR